MRFSQISRMSVVQESCESRRESYIRYDERALEQLAQQYVKNTGRVFGCSKKQDGAA